MRIKDDLNQGNIDGDDGSDSDDSELPTNENTWSLAGVGHFLILVHTSKMIQTLPAAYANYRPFIYASAYTFDSILIFRVV